MIFSSDTVSDRVCEFMVTVLFLSYNHSPKTSHSTIFVRGEFIDSHFVLSIVLK